MTLASTRLLTLRRSAARSAALVATADSDALGPGFGLALGRAIMVSFPREQYRDVLSMESQKWRAASGRPVRGTPDQGRGQARPRPGPFQKSICIHKETRQN